MWVSSLRLFYFEYPQETIWVLPMLLEKIYIKTWLYLLLCIELAWNVSTLQHISAI